MAKKILLIYATNSGGTEFASGIIKNVLEKSGHKVTIKKVNDTDPNEFASYDSIILGSPSWDYKGKEGQVHQDYLPFIEKLQGKTFPDKQFAVFGLGDSSYTYFCGSAGHLEDLVKTLQGKLITDTLRIDGFYFDQENNSKKIEEWASVITKQLNA